MGDQYARGEDYEKKAEKTLTGWGLFGSKYDDAADLFDKAANSFKLAKSWDKAASNYIKLANCHLESDSKHEAASSFVDAANCYKKISPKDAIKCLRDAVNLFMDIGRLSLAARYYKEMAELCESDQNIEGAIENFERAAEPFQSEEVTTSANQYCQKVAQFALQLEQYQKAIDIYEEIACHSLNNNLLKYGVKGIFSMRDSANFVRVTMLRLAMLWNGTRTLILFFLEHGNADCFRTLPPPSMRKMSQSLQMLSKNSIA